jgi:hypothetical protein
MIILALLIVLFLSFVFHIYFLFQYLFKAHKKYLAGFINTAVTNILIAILIIILLVYRPELIRGINPAQVLWVFSGLIFIVTLGIQINVFRRIYKTFKDPANYHLNYFGKKVLNGDAVSKFDVFAFFGAMPFLLVAGAYFIARLVNYILYHRL